MTPALQAKDCRASYATDYGFVFGPLRVQRACSEKGRRPWAMVEIVHRPSGRIVTVQASTRKLYVREEPRRMPKESR